MKHYTTLEQLRADKVQARRDVGKAAKRVKSDVKVCFVPQGDVFSMKHGKVLGCIGYAITAYKLYHKTRGFWKFVAKLL